MLETGPSASDHPATSAEVAASRQNASHRDPTDFNPIEHDRNILPGFEDLSAGPQSYRIRRTML